MESVGSVGPGVRAQTDEANYSPSHSPPLLQNVSGNDSSSGSPSGSRRHGSAGEKDKKNREERLRLIKERQEQDHEKRLAELKATCEKETKVRQMKDAERLRRIQEIKLKEAHRRHAVEERRRRLETEDKEKREQILAKYKEYEQRLTSQRDQKKPVYAFGSSTPRTLAYLEHLENSMRVYNSRLPTVGPGQDEESSSAKGSSSAEKRATSACSLTRKSLTASSSPNLSPLHQQQHHRGRITSGTYQHSQAPRTKNVLAPSGRWGGSMAASMYGGGAALSVAPTHRGAERDPLASARSMTTSFAVGETSAASLTKNVRAKGAVSPASAKSPAPRSARATAPQRKPRQQDVITEENEDGTGARQLNRHNQNGAGGGVSKRVGSDGGAEGVTGSAENKQKAKGVSSARTPSAPPPAVRRPGGDASSKVTAPAASKVNVSKDTSKVGAVAKAPAKQQPISKEQEAPKIIRKPKAVSPAPDNGIVTAPVPNGAIRIESDGLTKSPSDVVPEEPSNIDQSVAIAAAVEPVVNVDNIHLENDHLYEYKTNDSSQITQLADGRDEFVIRVESNPVEPSTPPGKEAALEDSNMQNVDMSQSTPELVPSVPKPTGQSTGKVLSKEEATAALAERRRLAREQMEREKELERQREEQRRLEEEEARRREEEEFRRQEQEELRMLEEARRLEEERIRKLVEEEGKRREGEAKQREDEQRKKAEAEARAREETERADRERKDAEEKFRKEEQDRLDRKKRLEAIMQRTRQGGATPSTPATKPDQQGAASPLVNGNNEGPNDSIYVTPDSAHVSSFSSSSVLKKIAHVRPEVGRSIESILNRVKSTPNVSGVEGTPGTTDSVMTTSLSADKVGTPAAGDTTRLTQSFYATPGEQFASFNLSGAEDTQRTEYDIDAMATKSESHYARILANEDSPGSQTNGATAALVSILGMDSNANQQNANSSDLYTGERNIVYHNNNVNGATAADHHGRGTEGAAASASASDSDASSAVTVIHQMSPRDLSADDTFSSPKKVGSTFDDLVNDNVATLDGNATGKVSQNVTAHQERPLMEF